MAKTIVQNGAEVLREIAAEVPYEEITSPKIQKVLSDMKEALEGERDGAAIAAPQIGVPLRIFIVSKRVLRKNEEDMEAKDMVCINPVLSRLSRKKEPKDEGCLSVRGYYGHVPRANRATIEAYNEYGKRFTRGASELLAQAFQHEMDHLDGILFIDKATEVWETKPEEEKAPE